MSSKPEPASEALANSSPAPPANSATPTGAANPAVASGGTAPAYTANNGGAAGGNAYPPNAYANQQANAGAGYQTGQYNTGGVPTGGANPQVQPAAAQNGFYAATPNGAAPGAAPVANNGNQFGGNQFGATPAGFNNPPAGQFTQQPAGQQAGGYQAQPPVNYGSQMAAAPQNGYPQTPHSPITTGPAARTAMANQPNPGYQAPPSNFEAPQSNFEVQQPAAGGGSRFSDGGTTNATYDAPPTQPATTVPTSNYQNSQPTPSQPYRPGSTSSFEGSNNVGGTFRS